MRRRLESRSCSSPSCSRGLSLSTSQQNSFLIEQIEKAKENRKTWEKNEKESNQTKKDKPFTDFRSLDLIKGLGGSVADPDPDFYSSRILNPTTTAKEE
jgi:hypothetical protein